MKPNVAGGIRRRLRSAQRSLPACAVPETQDAHGLPFGIWTVDDEAGAEREETRAGSFGHHNANFWRSRNGFTPVDQCDAKPLRCGRIVTRDVCHDALQVLLAAR